VLNDCIVQTEAGGSTEKASDLRDQRDNLLNELSNLVEFGSYEDEKGSVTVMAGMRNLVNGKTTKKLSTAVSIDGNLALQLDGIDITSRINKGQLGGLIASREDAESSLTGLRKLVAAITNELNILHKQGFGLDGTRICHFSMNSQFMIKI
jgi:flagellar hook-associated protein 1 FlgK